MKTMDKKTAARELFESARRPVILTGAGISVSVGLATYRGEDGLWTKDPLADQHSAPPPAHMTDPALRRKWWDGVWGLWGPMREIMPTIDPSVAHQAIADWENSVDEMLIVTTNVDYLHQRAGSTDVVELHGSLNKTRCSRGRCKSEPREDFVTHTEALLCRRCGSPERPDVVLFTEGLDPRNWERVMRSMSQADLLVVVGTSGTVGPANQLPAMAQGYMPVVRIDPGDWHGPAVGWDVEVGTGADEFFRGF